MLITGLLVMLIGFMGMVSDDDNKQVPDRRSTELEDYPPVAKLKVKLRDGRCLAYQERGVPKNRSNYKIIIVHGFGSSKEMKFPVSQELVEELGVYFLLFDRAGYGDSDPNPKRTVKSEALDIQDLADQLQLGPKFYLIGVSMGSYATWSCLKYIPHRLAGVALVVPIVNYWWPSIPEDLIKMDFRKKLIRWSRRIAKHAPGLLHWWVSQKGVPSKKDPTFFNDKDIEILKKTTGFPMLSQGKLRDRDIFDSLRSDFLVGFGRWDFDPLDLSDPFPQNEGSVHIWQGQQDRVVPYELQRYVSKRLPWIRYHEVPEGGHLIVHYNGICDAILRSLLIGEEMISYAPSSGS